MRWHWLQNQNPLSQQLIRFGLCEVADSNFAGVCDDGRSTRQRKQFAECGQLCGNFGS